MDRDAVDAGAAFRPFKAMIIETTGDLLQADAEALVNAVNTVGTSGKGLALQFQRAFPDNDMAYRLMCSRGEVRPGRMFVHETKRGGAPLLIINFPTKRHWRQRSRLDDIKVGLQDLASVVRERQVRSVAVPALGCGLGGLSWDDVRPLIVAALGPLPDVRVMLYGPEGC
jgi:O-acetyl-ADP-ribose deacetylase (regulator of RNase III)